ncbi:hypothetical protein B0F90DRAFT_1667553 [Multifurca ochricompacta]|uniref:Extracellular serine-rich protein n=1 Tax=Multifurca ochricompacta TaxID=376703 RepID=A0AAD4M506_9AGAM|nr:hypothetical protein B0F90DRAFT_1667553 [Multifurca ochricompacta]
MNAPVHAGAVLVIACLAAAKTIVITVGGNTTTFVPQSVAAALGDIVTFNFVSGNHTATESTFSNPCIPAHETDITINGFDSGFRETRSNTSGSILTVPILIQNVNHTFWFFDYNSCGEGGVGVINDNESSTETLAGFVRNAIRLNGTSSSDNTSTSTSSRPSSTTSSSPSVSASKSAADRAFWIGASNAIPLFIASLFI